MPDWGFKLLLPASDSLWPNVSFALEERHCADKVNPLAAKEHFSGMITAHNTAVASKNQHGAWSFLGIACISWFRFHQSQMRQRGGPVFT